MKTLYSLTSAYKILVSSAFLFLLVGCFDHDKPLVEKANTPPEPKLLGVWKVENELIYYSIESANDKSLKVKGRRFRNDEEELGSDNQMNGFEYHAGAAKVLVLQNYIGKWGHYHYRIESGGIVLKLRLIEGLIDKPKDEAVKALSDPGKPEEYVLKFHKTPLKTLPTSAPREDLLAYKLQEEEKKLKELEAKKASGDKPKPAPADNTDTPSDDMTAEAQNARGDVFYKGEAKDYAEAIKWYRLAANRGFAAAQHTLGSMYDKGHGVEIDKNEAMKWFRLAADQKYPAAQRAAGNYYAFGYTVKIDLVEATRLYKLAADQGDAQAQYNLGVCYSNGDGVEKDKSKAFILYRKAAEQSNAHAQYNLGLYYAEGNGVEKNLSLAFSWYKKSAEQGHASAQVNLGLCYDKGVGVDRNDEEAEKWYLKAAEQGKATAQLNLGFLYLNGEGVIKDHTRAFEWFTKSANQGNAAAQNELANCYEYGIGVAKDLSEAVNWYRKAADQGDSDAQYSLGYKYEFGISVKKDLAEAAEWYHRSAELGNVDAQISLGIAHSEGKGVKKSPEKARRWFQIALDQDDARAYFMIGRYLYTNPDKFRKTEAFSYIMKASAKGYVSADYFAASIHAQGFVEIQSVDVVRNAKIEQLAQDKKKSYSILLSITQPERLKKFKEEAEYAEKDLYSFLGSISLDVRAYDTAFEYFNKSAALNDVNAIFMLGYCTQKGYGCKPDKVKAMKLFVAAREGGSKEAAEVIYEIEHPEVFVTCGWCNGSGRVPETTVSYKNCPECGGRRGKYIRR